MAEDDDDKRNRGRNDGPRPKRPGGRPSAGPAGERPRFRPAGPKASGKPGQRQERDGEQRPARRFVKRDEAQGERAGPPKRNRFEGKPRPGRRERASEQASAGAAAGDEGRRSRPFAPRGGDRKPFAAGEGKPLAKREGKPFGQRRDREAGTAEGGSQPGRRAPERKSAPRGEGGSFQKRPADRGEPRRDRAERPARAAPTGDPAAAQDPAEGAERIAKRLARAGIASRRDAEALIADGRVTVNGKVLTSPAFNVLASDRIELDGQEIPPVERTRLFLFHKPAGVVTTNRDPEGRRTVFDVLPADLPRLMTVGRLDINTEGLLLLTNDGGLARLLELPATGWLRRYRARVHGKVNEEALAGLKDGIAVDGVFYGSVEATLDREQGSNAWLTLGLREGKNREVKNILGALGLEVSRLIRVSYGPFQLGELAEGTVQELKGRMLREQLGERLIEESGANFEAPIVKPFSNKPVARERDAEETRPARPRIVRDGIQGKIGEGGLIKRRDARRHDRQDERDSALSRLTTTRPDRPGFAKTGKGKSPAGGKDRPFGGRDKPFAGKDRREERPEPAKPRTANVWMAPGARPQGKKDAAEGASAPRTRSGGDAEGQRNAFKKAGKPRPKRDDGAPSSPRPSRRRGEGKGGGGADRRR